MKVDNAIILSAGTSSRFAPISYEIPKALIEVRGEILIERQIKQIKESGINEIIVVTGYKPEKFEYLSEKYGVTLIHNPDYLTRNNNSSIFYAKDYLKNSYICSSDNYFLYNPFENEVDESYYSCVFVKGKTDEWCVNEKNGIIKSVVIGSENSWVMLGHVFWDKNFSKKFLSILEQEYEKPETTDKLWETIYLEHIDKLKMKIRKYPKDYIFEFDTLDELRAFDSSYIENSRSDILKKCAKFLNTEEKNIKNITAIKDTDNIAVGFRFSYDKEYIYYYKTGKPEEIKI